MTTHEAEYSLESVVRGHHVYKYICTPCLGEQRSLVPICARLVSYYAVSVIKMRDGGPHTENHLLCHDYRFRVTPSAWQCTLPVRGSVMKCIRLINGVIRDKTMRLTDEYVPNSEVCLTSRLYSILTCMYMY